MVAVAAALANEGSLEARPGTAREWRHHFSRIGRSSLEQSWSYGDAVARHFGAEVRRHVIYSTDRPIALVQGFRTRSYRYASINRIVRGPLWLEDVPEAQRLAGCRLIQRAFRQRVSDLLFWLPELPDSPDSRRFMRALGTRRMVTGYSTVWLDIRPDESQLRAALHRKWRNSLRAAEKSGLRVRPVTRARAIDDALQSYDAFRRNRRFIGPPADLIRQMRSQPPGAGNEDNVRIWQATAGAVPVGGVAMIRHGASATYLAGWTSDDGRAGNAHNLLLWRAIGELRATGTDWLDLGGVDTQSAPGIARFKLGLGGALCTQAGTYL